MTNPLIIEEPFWNGRRLISATAIIIVLVIAGVRSGGETVLTLAITAAAPLACLWVPYAVANFPLAGMLFSGRPASHTSSEDSVVPIGWILLVAWVGYSMFKLFG